MRNTASPTSNRVYGREKYLISCSMAQWSRGLFLEGPDNFSGPKFYVCRVCIQDESFSYNFEDDTMRVLANEAKLTSLWARNCATNRQALILKFAFEPEKLPGFSRNGALGPVSRKSR